MAMINEQELEQAFNAAMEEESKNPKVGLPFSVYLAPFLTDDAPASMTALRQLVGGDHSKARIAFRVIKGALKPSIVKRERPEWFLDVQKSIYKNVEDLMNQAWAYIDQDIQATALKKSEIIEAELNLVRAENVELYAAIEDLESVETAKLDELSKLENEIRKLKSIKEDIARLELENDYLRKDNEKLNNNLLTKDEELINLWKLQIEFNHINSLSDKYEKEISTLKDNINQLITKIPAEYSKDNIANQAMDISEKVQAELNNLKGIEV
ncbi:hypothetical protein [Vibrio sp. 1180_3]|uniref:hypothetical protein n=1 Tax=Vibrio sp. 1180_3 TaxID=2528832 RepID=UPI002407253F|nr:hypothetical protein [Vibrio sp. 1180_3]MDF9401778.1 hypothetical protein [Vibrio sp. 1180_3]